MIIKKIKFHKQTGGQGNRETRKQGDKGQGGKDTGDKGKGDKETRRGRQGHKGQQTTHKETGGQVDRGQSN